MAVVGTVHHHGALTDVRADAATHQPEQISVYLCFRTAEGQQEFVEIAMHEAALLEGRLLDILRSQEQ